MLQLSAQERPVHSCHEMLKMAYRSRLDHKSSSSSTCRARREKLAVFALPLLGTSVSCSPHLFNHWCGTELGLLGVWSATQRACVVREGLQLLKLPPCIYLYVLLYFVVFSLCAFCLFSLSMRFLDTDWVGAGLKLGRTSLISHLCPHNCYVETPQDRYLWPSLTHTATTAHKEQIYNADAHKNTHFSGKFQLIRALLSLCPAG